MKTIHLLLAGVLISAWALPASAQPLKAGFDRNEYIEMMHISARTVADSAYAGQFPAPRNYRMIYRSPTIGLDNLWDLWVSPDGKAVISLRGTTTRPESWLENFYAAMAPATGEIQLAKKEKFTYQLTNDLRAGVHVGWLVGMAFLARDIVPKMDSLVGKGTQDFLIVGHSQGGGIAYLLTAHLRSLQKTGRLPAGLRFKTYCSAAPKPGNLYFAYAYEALTQNGWAYNIINAADWVPEVPVTIQTLDDFNRTNPFMHAEGIIKKQKFPRNVMMRHVYNKLNRPARKAQRNYQKYLGRMTSRMVAKKIKGFKAPTFYQSNHYVRTGTSIILTPDEAYYQLFPEDSSKVWSHHFHKPYLYLAGKLGAAFYEADDASLDGNWELEYITGVRIAFAGLYPNAKPKIAFHLDRNELSGNTACNTFRGRVMLSGSAIRITAPQVTTMTACPGEGEMRFLEMLQKADRYAVDGGSTLTFFHDDVPMMRFRKLK